MAWFTPQLGEAILWRMRAAEQKIRVLAIDLRPRQFGYAVFEGPNHLIDWGGRTYDSCSGAGTRMTDLIELFHPTVAIVRRDRHFGVRSPAKMAALLRCVKQAASAHSVPVHLVTAADIQDAFRSFHIQNKDGMALLLATIFPDLHSKLPPKRKQWEHEHHRMIIFDAVAAGFSHFWQNGTPWASGD